MATITLTSGNTFDTNILYKSETIDARNRSAYLTGVDASVDANPKRWNRPLASFDHAEDYEYAPRGSAEDYAQERWDQAVGERYLGYESWDQAEAFALGWDSTGTPRPTAYQAWTIPAWVGA